MKRIVPAAAMILLSLTLRVFASPDTLLSGLTPNGLVNDFAGVIDQADEARISNLVREVEQKTTAAICVVTVKSLEGGDVNDFAVKLFEKWGIGKAGKDNGILVLTAMEDRKMRIEVGYGLEGALPDSKAGRIMDEFLVPAFKQGKFGAGLYDTAAALAAVVAKEANISLTNIAVSAVATAVTNAPAGGTPPVNSGMSGLIVLGIFALVIILIAIASKKGWIKPGGSGTPGSGGGSSSSPSSGSSSSPGGGGRSGGGGASRSW